MLGLALLIVLTLASVGAFRLASLLPTSPLFLSLGYVGVFLLTTTCSATLFLPVPSWGAITIAGSYLNPFLLGVVAGAGAATGELTGYLAGRGGRLVLGADACGPLGRVRALVGRHGFVTLFLLSAVPNPLFDVAGLTAGSLGFSPIRYWIAVALGKSVVYTVLALAGQSLLPLVSLNDHTPGQGQFRDLEPLKRYHREALGATAGELGMTIAAGAPHVVRGGSSSGNLAAEALISEGLLNVLCADYHAPALLLAAWKLAGRRLVTLPEAVKMVSLNPARANGLDQRIGSIAVEEQADLAVVDPDGPAPVIDLTVHAGVPLLPCAADPRPSFRPDWAPGACSDRVANERGGDAVSVRPSRSGPAACSPFLIATGVHCRDRLGQSESAGPAPCRTANRVMPRGGRHVAT